MLFLGTADAADMACNAQRVVQGHTTTMWDTPSLRYKLVQDVSHAAAPAGVAAAADLHL
jgi:hypothetical protein